MAERLVARVAFVEQTAWPNYRDDVMYHVATPAIYLLDGAWYLYFQAAHSGFYCNQPWALFGLRCDRSIAALLDG